MYSIKIEKWEMKQRKSTLLQNSSTIGKTSTVHVYFTVLPNKCAILRNHFPNIL